jgi:hypothetical protein
VGKSSVNIVVWYSERSRSKRSVKVYMSKNDRYYFPETFGDNLKPETALNKAVELADKYAKSRVVSRVTVEYLNKKVLSLRCKPRSTPRYEVTLNKLDQVEL